MILVTGASGFLGQHLLQALAQQPVPVRALYRTTQPKTTYANVSWMACDLLDIFVVEEALKGVTHIYHCAAVVSYDARRSAEMIRDNVAGTANLVNAALEAGVEKLLHVSSVATLGRMSAEPGSLITEETYWEEHKANSAYSESKYRAEMEVWRAMAEGLNAAIINPGIILGEGDWSKGSSRLMEIVYNEFPWYTEGINAWVDVEDVVTAMLLLMQSGISDERYIISAGNFSYREIFTGMAEALQRKPPYRNATPLMSEIVWRAEVIKSRLAGKETTISRESARTAQAQCRYSNEKFCAQFPQFRYHSLQDTFSRMAQAYLR